MEAVRGVSLRVAAGEYVSIMGPSGSGKSTLMHMMGALDTPSTGRALFDGKDLNALSDRERSRLRRTRIGFVFQFFNLLPTLTAVENVAMPLLLGGVGRGKALKAAADSLDRIGMSRRAGHYPEEMSGGEMQRVAIARALVGDPEAILCDEPTGNLDSANSQEILKLLREPARVRPPLRRHGDARPARRRRRRPHRPHPRRRASNPPKSCPSIKESGVRGQ